MINSFCSSVGANLLVTNSFSCLPADLFLFLFLVLIIFLELIPAESALLLLDVPYYLMLIAALNLYSAL